VVDSRKMTVLVVFVACSMLQAKIPLVGADDKLAGQISAGVELLMKNDVRLYLCGGSHFGHQMEQYKNDVIPYKNNDLSALEGACGFVAALGKMGKIDVAAGGEIALVKKYLVHDSTSSADLFLSVPTGIINLCLPFGDGFKVEVFNRLERRNVRSPVNHLVSKLRYTPQTRITSRPFTGAEIAPYIYYEGFSMKESQHLAGWGFGLSLQPVSGVKVSLADAILWQPGQLGSTVVHQATLNLVYSFDFRE